MSIQVKRRREAASFLSSFTGAQGELIVDTTNNRVQVHDGVTAGGWPAAKLSEVIVNTRTAVGDVNYTALATDRSIAYAAITAARTVTLPASSSYPTGTRLAIFDESGSCSATNTITVAAAGSDTIDGAASALISSPYGYLSLQSNGSGKWTIIDQTTTSLSAVAVGTPFDPNNVLSVYGQSALFNSAGNFNVTVNKGGSGGASSDTASFIFEDGFSGRAQIGLCGDDNFHFKVSPNGSTWYDALDLVNSSGLVKANYGLSVAGGDLVIGSNTPTAPLTITTQTAALPTPVGGTQIHLIGANGVEPIIQWNGYGNNGVFLFEIAGGSLGSETALVSGEAIGQFSFRGYTGAAYSSTAARIQAFAAANWSSTSTPTGILFSTTAAGATSFVNAMTVYNGVVIGSGTTDPGAGNLTVGGSIGIGTAAPTAPLTITTQTATLPTPQSGTVVHLIGANGASNAVVWNAYANNGSFTFIRADGSLGAEQAVGAGENLGGFTVKGYNGSAYSGNSGIIVAKTVGAWSSTNQGTFWAFYTTPQNSTSNAVAMGVYAGVVVGSGTTDPGAGNLSVGGAMQVGAPTGGVLSAGSINVAGGIYLNNTAYTNPDFVFEQYFTGAVQKYADRPRAKSYAGLMPLDDLAVHIRESLRLPGIDDRPTDIFERGDIALEKLEEHTLYILGLHARVTALESSHQ
jgi:hypothetical protein